MKRLFYGVNTELYAFSEISLREKLLKCDIAEPAIIEVILDGCEVDEKGLYVNLSHFLDFRFFRLEGEKIVEIPSYEIDTNEFLIDSYANKILTKDNLDYFEEQAKIERGEKDYFLTLFNCGNVAFFADKNIKNAFSARGVYLKERK